MRKTEKVAKTPEMVVIPERPTTTAEGELVTTKSKPCEVEDKTFSVEVTVRRYTHAGEVRGYELLIGDRYYPADTLPAQMFAEGWK